MKSKKTLLISLLGLFIVENLLYFSYLFLRNKSHSKVLSYSTESDVCPLVCQELIDKKINLALAKLNNNTTTTATTKTINYLPLGNGGSTKEREWTAVSGSDFSFDLGDYPGKIKVYWLANLKAEYGNSRCYARVYDKTNFRAVDFSEQSTSQISFETLTSQPLTIWSGENKYRLEIKSLNGISCHLESPKLMLRY